MDNLAAAVPAPQNTSLSCRKSLLGRGMLKWSKTQHLCFPGCTLRHQPAERAPQWINVLEERRGGGRTIIAGQVDLVSLADNYQHFVMVLPPAPTLPVFNRL